MLPVPYTGTVGGHAPIISMHGSCGAEAPARRGTNRGCPRAVSIKPTQIAAIEARTHKSSIRIYLQMTYQLKMVVLDVFSQHSRKGNINKISKIRR